MALPPLSWPGELKMSEMPKHDIADLAAAISEFEEKLPGWW